MSVFSRQIAGVGMVIALVLLIGNAWVSYRNTVDLNDRQHWVEHTQTVITELLGTKGSASDSLSLLRGYFLSGNSDLVVPAQAYVGKFLVTFKDYPPRQKPASFNLDEVMQELQKDNGS